MRTLLVLAVTLTLGAGCATTDGPADPNHRQMRIARVPSAPSADSAAAAAAGSITRHALHY